MKVNKVYAEEEKSRQVLASMRLERNLRDKSAAKKMWIFLGIVFAVSVTMSVIGNRNKLAENERRLAVTAEALLSAPDGKMTITIKENMKTAAPQQSTKESN